MCDRLQIRKDQRQRLEDAIESLISLLDLLDGDPDAEPDIDHAVDDEPCDDLEGEAEARFQRYGP